MSTNKFPQHIQELYKHGERCLENLYAHLYEWPNGEYCRRIEFSIRAKADKQKIYKALLDAEAWLSAVSVQRTIHDQRKLKDIRRMLEFAVLEEDYKDNSMNDVKVAMEEALALVKSIPLTENTNMVDYRLQPVLVPNTAFIMMAMDPAQPELEDVCWTIKEVCSCFRIKAFRADDIPHEGQITDVVFAYIATSELLIADLTGEKQNVYYEVGRAHALNKQPILFRKSGTKIHFNLAGNKVLEYRNFSELKKLLQDRLEGMYKAA